MLLRYQYNVIPILLPIRYRILDCTLSLYKEVRFRPWRQRGNQYILMIFRFRMEGQRPAVAYRKVLGIQIYGVGIYNHGHGWYNRKTSWKPSRYKKIQLALSQAQGPSNPLRGYHRYVHYVERKMKAWRISYKRVGRWSPYAHRL